jgi:hypothetical protein
MELVRTVVVFDAEDPHAESAFGRGSSTGTSSKTRPFNSVIDAAGEWRIGVQLAPNHVSPDWPEGAPPQPVHLDLHIGNPGEAHEMALALGARVAMWACFQPDRWRSTISIRPCAVRRALRWDTEPPGWVERAFESHTPPGGSAYVNVAAPLRHGRVHLGATSPYRWTGGTAAQILGVSVQYVAGTSAWGRAKSRSRLITRGWGTASILRRVQQCAFPRRLFTLGRSEGTMHVNRIADWSNGNATQPSKRSGAPVAPHIRVHQPRERAVGCVSCGRSTWEVHAVCATCGVNTCARCAP